MLKENWKVCHWSGLPVKHLKVLVPLLSAHQPEILAALFPPYPSAKFVN